MLVPLLPVSLQWTADRIFAEIRSHGYQVEQKYSKAEISKNGVTAWVYFQTGTNGSGAYSNLQIKDFYYVAGPINRDELPGHALDLVERVDNVFSVSATINLDALIAKGYLPQLDDDFQQLKNMQDEAFWNCKWSVRDTSTEMQPIEMSKCVNWLTKADMKVLLKSWAWLAKDQINVGSGPDWQWKAVIDGSEFGCYGPYPVLPDKNPDGYGLTLLQTIQGARVKDPKA